MPNIENWEVASIDDTGKITADGGFAGQIFASGHTTYVADGAIALTDSVVKLDASGASTVMTIAAGTEGQEIKIVCVSASNLCTVGFISFNPGFNLLTFAIGDSAILSFTDNDWIAFSINGAVIS